MTTGTAPKYHMTTVNAYLLPPAAILPKVGSVRVDRFLGQDWLYENNAMLAYLH
jgi:hypothetical protein